MNQYLTDIIDISSKSGTNVAINQKGKVYVWPFQKDKSRYLFRPLELPIPI